MSTLPKSLYWQRLDADGGQTVLYSDSNGLHAKGIVVAATPVPYILRYEVVTDGGWNTAHIDLTTEGAGWLRTARLERAVGRWRVTTAEQGDLDSVLARAGRPGAGGWPGMEDPDRLRTATDVDVENDPLFNTLPIRRLRMLEGSDDRPHRLTVAFVRVPSLQVLPSEQFYTRQGPATIGYTSGNFTTEIAVDEQGFVTRYPGLAARPS
ncbi:putative glycolipid-binding domain-containing protein [Rhizomonospora bruguierae]|uniref:putative glycolipid-binding domain-containing protein n=1 Tax=Rhizomonospora bruguierae TaxID=1581705 RepID=UPI001BD1896D|nr:putative glycolipid-binding domain-containing protein [Micromonospora sp. NBRC 107566]